MKRRTFILMTMAAGAATLPVVKYKGHKFIPHDPLLRPDVLARFCDEDQICEIGKRYRSKFPAENEKKKLTELILTKDNGQRETSTDKNLIDEFIQKKIQQDFTANKTIVVDGWIISETEARQCALVSLAIN